MIISHRHKFIFFAVPKTATHSVREVMRTHMVEGDWEQQVLFGQNALPIPEIARLKHGHITAREIRPHLGPGQWHTYFKFAFVRNPFDRFVSVCYFLNRDNPNFARIAQNWMKQALRRPRFRERVLVRPQVLQLVDEHGDIAMDYVGRYETLQQSLDDISDRLRVPPTTLPQKNASEHAVYTECYDDELRDMVANFYAADLRSFGYDFQ